MDRSQTRLLLALSALVALVAAALWWRGRETVAERDGDPVVVWDVAPEAVTRVRVLRRDGELVLERADDGWHVRVPFDAPADDVRVGDLLRGLTQLRRGQPVPGAGAPAEYGLGADPLARVTLSGAAGDLGALDIGRRAPVGWRTYVRVGDAVVAASGDPTESLEAPAESYRDLHVFRVLPGDVRRVVVATPDGTLDVRGEGLDWHLAGWGRADPDRVDELVTALLDTRFDRLEPDLTAGPPRRVVTLETADGDRAVLEIGAEDPGAEDLLARGPDGRVGRLWAERVLHELGRGPHDVGQATAFLVDLERTDDITVTLAGPPSQIWRFRRNGPEWTATAGEPGVALDPGTVYAAVEALAALAPTYRRSPPPAPAGGPPPAPPNPAAPEARVTVTHTPADRDPVVYAFTVGPDQAGHHALRAEGGPDVVPEGALLLKHAPWEAALEALRSLR